MLAETLPRSASAAMRNRLSEHWDTHKDGLLRSLEARMRERTETLEKRLNERRDKQIADITHILTELQQSIREELAVGEEPLQLQLWSEQEKDQLKRDRDNLEARLKRIPDEIAQETTAIEARYANPTPRLLPIAVTYLIPAALV